MTTLDKTLALHYTRVPMTLSLPFALAILSGCSLTPDYSAPDEPGNWVYKEAPALAQSQMGSWKQAQPAEEQLRGQWWRVFGDPRLDQLEEQAALANPGLQAAAARLKQSRALQRDAWAEKMLRVDAASGPSRQRESPASQGLPDGASANTFTLWRAELGISYEVDLVGRVDAQVEAATAELEKSGALYRTVLLALQADVAEHYFQIRELDTQLYVYRRTLELRNDT